MNPCGRVTGRCYTRYIDCMGPFSLLRKILYASSFSIVDIVAEILAPLKLIAKTPLTSVDSGFLLVTCLVYAASKEIH